jgi:hydrogenase maturation protease
MTVLVVGYGNPLRSDDGVGWHVAGRLVADPRFADCEVLQRHQLTPELALDISRAELVVLVDARSGLASGSVVVERTVAAAAAGHARASSWSHHLGPAGLVELAVELYGRSGELVVVSVGVESLEIGERLSPAVEGSLDRVGDTVAAVISAWRLQRAGNPVVGTGHA